MTNPRARIGFYGRAVHALSECLRRGEMIPMRPDAPLVRATADWGASLYGSWAGEARLTDEPISCRRCRAMS